MSLKPVLHAALVLALAACGGAPATAYGEASDLPFAVTPSATFDEPWAMSFLPDGRLLVTEKPGKLKLYTVGGTTIDVAGVPAVAYGGQGGLGDVVPHPRFAENGLVYLSYAEAGDGDLKGAAVARARLGLGEAPRLEEVKVIWRQVPKVTGRGHYGHRIAFGPDGLLYISSGDRQKFDPAQDMTSTMGKVVRLNDDGTPAAGNPFAADGGATAEIWSLGHRNPLGLAFDPEGRLWNSEMGPANGDELNLVRRGANYGYPKVSNGDHYDGRNIPDHAPGDGFEAPRAYWVPAISPGSLMIYSGDLFPQWKGDAFLGALGGMALVRVDLDGETATMADEWPMGARIREVEQGPDGAIWLLEDEHEGSGGRLLRLTPR